MLRSSWGPQMLLFERTNALAQSIAGASLGRPGKDSKPVTFDAKGQRTVRDATVERNDATFPTFIRPTRDVLVGSLQAINMARAHEEMFLSAFEMFQRERVPAMWISYEGIQANLSTLAKVMRFVGLPHVTTQPPDTLVESLARYPPCVYVSSSPCATCDARDPRGRWTRWRAGRAL
jgi:hypothetical protein